MPIILEKNVIFMYLSLKRKGLFKNVWKIFDHAQKYVFRPILYEINDIYIIITISYEISGWGQFLS